MGPESSEMDSVRKSLLDIDLLLGSRGCKWIEVPPSMVERWNSIFLVPICSRFDCHQIKTQLAFYGPLEFLVHREQGLQ